MSRKESIWRGTRLSAALTVPALLCLVLTVGCPTVPPDDNDPNDTTPPPPTTGNSGISGKFVGTTRCQQCHANIHTTWTGTLHATALESLEAIGEGTNAQCLPCHTVGFGETGGFVNRATTNDLAGVGCESCHEGAGAHASNASDASLRPKVNLSATVCGRCHSGTHQPTFEDWSTSHHAAVNAELVPRFASGTSLTSCGQCHSGDYFYYSIIQGETVTDSFLTGKTADQMTGITCAICHDPHSPTGNANPEDGRDYQLRYPLVKFTTPTTSLTAAQDSTRFNLCGQCHHTRDRVWTDSSREPHPSDQVNVFFGEIPSPASNPAPIVPFRVSVHLNAPEQCSTCHVFRSEATAVAPAVSGHTFEVNYESCADCHGTAEIGKAKLDGLKAEVDLRLSEIEETLNAWGLANNIESKGALSWEFTSEGGPATAGQTKIPDAIKKARYIYYYIDAGGGSGAHNPDFVRDALIHALEYAENAPPKLP